MGWLKQHARDGNVGAWSYDIADAIRWPFAVDLATAFRDAGLLDAAGVLVGWAELNGWLVGRAEKDRARHRKPRKEESGSTGAGRSDGRTDGRTEGRARGVSAEPPRSELEPAAPVALPGASAEAPRSSDRRGLDQTTATRKRQGRSA
jgi:hypothetical protein